MEREVQRQTKHRVRFLPLRGESTTRSLPVRPRDGNAGKKTAPKALLYLSYNYHNRARAEEFPPTLLPIMAVAGRGCETVRAHRWILRRGEKTSTWSHPERRAPVTLRPATPTSPLAGPPARPPQPQIGNSRIHFRCRSIVEQASDEGFPCMRVGMRQTFLHPLYFSRIPTDPTG